MLGLTGRVPLVCLWLGVRRTILVLFAGACVVGLCVPLSRLKVSTPTILGGGAGTVLVGSLVPVAWSCVLALALDSRRAQMEWRFVRRVHLYDAAWLSVVVGVPLLGLYLSAPHATFSRVGAHVLLLGGAAALLTVFVTSGTAALVISVAFLVTASYSPYLDGARYVRLLEPEGAIGLAWATGIALALVGTTLIALSVGRRPAGGHA